MEGPKDISSVMLALSWCCLNVDTFIYPRFRSVVPSEARLAAMFGLARFTFCSGLLAVMRGQTPPPTTWLEAISNEIPKKCIWGVLSDPAERWSYSSCCAATALDHYTKRDVLLRCTMVLVHMTGYFYDTSGIRWVSYCNWSMCTGPACNISSSLWQLDSAGYRSGIS